MTRRGRVGWAAGVAVLVAAGVLWLRRESPAPVPAEPPTMAVPSGAAPASDPVAATASAAAQAPQPFASSAPRADVPASALGTGPVVTAASASPPGAASWQLCGLGAVPAPPGAAPLNGDLPDLPAPLGRHALDAVRERTAAALRLGDLRARAAATLLKPDAVPDSADAWRASADPAVLLWARARCPADADGAACRLALVQAAVRAEPSNAEPWVALLAEDPTQLDTVWQRVLQADRWESHFGTFTATVMAAVPADVPAYLRMMLAVESFGIESTLPLPPLAPLLRRCAGRGGAEAPERRAECDRLAHLLTERSDTLLVAGIGRRVAETAGWPPERLAALEAEQKALQARTRALAPDPEQPLGCAGTQAFLGYLQRLPQGGELAALRSLPPATR